MMNPDKQELIIYRVKRAKETLKEASLLMRNDMLNSSVNRIYYACFYAVTALLAASDIETKTRSGTRQMFGLHFIKPGVISERSGSFYRDIFDLRQTGDYEDFIVFEKNNIVILLQSAMELIGEIEEVLSPK